MWYRTSMKKKPPVDDKQHHVRISHRGYERLAECLRKSPVNSRRQLLDAIIRGCSIAMDVEPMLERRWRKTPNRKKASRARKAGR